MSMSDQLQLGICVFVLMICGMLWLVDFNTNNFHRKICEEYAEKHGGHVEGYSAGAAYATKYGEQFSDAGFKVIMPNGSVKYDKDIINEK